MLHKRKVWRSLKGNMRRGIRILLRIKPRPKAPVLAQPIENILERHRNLCRLALQFQPASLEDAMVCEVGPGDCLATAALFFGLGARHVDLVEIEPPVVNEKQARVLSELKEEGEFPMDIEAVMGSESGKLNESRVTYHNLFMEELEIEDRFEFVFSENVLEHVEDLEGFFAACWRSLKPGGTMAHIIDLGGHGEFEDPLPPLDFQTYPDWLYALMFPRYHRATRRFVSQYEAAARSQGFTVDEPQALRTVNDDYLQSIRPRLRPAAKARPDKEISIIEFALLGRKE